MSVLNSGTFAYNGIIWASLYKSKVEVKPVKDSAGRALVARQYTIDVEGRIAAAPGSTTDGTLANMRKLLEMPAGALMYVDKGFGTLNVNLPGGKVWDAAYGPWPEVLSWDPIGNDQGCVVRWRCTTLVPCEEDPTPKGIIEYCWEESWSIDEHSYTTRTIDGHLTIQATRSTVGNRNIPDNADAYREQIVPDLPQGFTRKQTYKLSEDKRTLTFHFEDSELPEPLPDGVTGADVRQADKWSIPKPGQKNILTSTISGTITLPARADKSLVWQKIMLILRSRWPIGEFPIGIKVKGAGLQKVSVFYMLQSLEITEEIFGRSSSFSATVWLLPRDSAPAYILEPGLLLQTTGLWTPLPDTSFVRWKGSVFSRNGNSSLGPRGVAGMTFQNQDDAIVDLCGRQKPRAINARAPGQARLPPGQLPRQPNGAILDPAASWLMYRLRLRLIENDRIARHKPLGGISKLKTVQPLDGFLTSDYQNSPGMNIGSGLGGALGTSSDETNSPGGQGPGYVGKLAAPELLQQVSAPKYTIRLEGHAVRIGYGIPTPRLATVGTVPATQIHQEVAQEQVSAIGGVPVYAAAWSIDYALPYAVAEFLPMPFNPAVW